MDLEKKESSLKRDKQQIKGEVHLILDQFKDKISPETYQKICNSFIDMLDKNLPAKDVLGISPYKIEEAYQYAYNLFQSGKYASAIEVFQWLRRLDFSQSRFSFAIAAAYHYQKQYEDAAANYIMAQYLDPFNPLPSFHLYDCFMKTKHYVSALYAIVKALTLMDKSADYTTLRAKAEFECEHVKQILANQAEKV